MTEDSPIRSYYFVWFIIQISAHLSFERYWSIRSSIFRVILSSLLEKEMDYG